MSEAPTDLSQVRARREAEQCQTAMVVEATPLPSDRLVEGR
jgi:hypothetical protein